MTLDQAEALAENAGAATLQEYCANLLAHAIEVERVKHHVSEVEAKRGPLEGLKEIAEDPRYLAEWQERSESAESKASEAASVQPTESDVLHKMTIPVESLNSLVLPEQTDEMRAMQDDGFSEEGTAADATADDRFSERPIVRLTPARPAGPHIKERVVPEVLNLAAIEVVRSHVGPAEDPHGFLPSIRAGRAVLPAKAEELLAALRRIESDHHGASLLDRGLSCALHRLALESQVLLTEAWPGVFDDRTVGTIRAVQEMVERILSGQDIRYYESAEHHQRSNARE
jgi:hypothetical protein